MVAILAEQTQPALPPALREGHQPATSRFRVSAGDLSWQSRADSLAGRQIDYIDHDWFHEPEAEQRIEAVAPAEPVQTLPARRPTKGLAFISDLVATTPPSGAEERYLFLRMNYLRFRAATAQQALNTRRRSRKLVEQIEADLRDAEAVRNQIVQSNLRLVVSIARKLATSLDQLSELVSEGLLPLMRAVELFDVQLGYRFSTYATWAVRNQLLRALKKRQNCREFVVDDDESPLARLPDLRRAEPEQSSAAVTVVQKLLAELSERERHVLAARFGLSGNPEGQSLGDLSVQFGLSKERVRQIALKAITTLQQRVAGCDDVEELLQQQESAVSQA